MLSKTADVFEQRAITFDAGKVLLKDIENRGEKDEE